MKNKSSKKAPLPTMGWTYKRLNDLGDEGTTTNLNGLNGDEHAVVK